MTYPTEPLPLRRQKDTQDRERLAEAAHRKRCAKHKGRNHWRNWERRKMLEEKKKKAKIAKGVIDAARSRYLKASRAYWSGESDSHPT